MKFIDYYEVLGVPRTATAKEIKTAYWKLAREHHPDLYQGDAKQNAEEQFKRINEAYEVLGDTEKREKYDRLGMNWRSGEDFAAPEAAGGWQDLDGFGFSDFFASMFGNDFRRHHSGARQGGRSARGEDVDAQIAVSIEDLVHGAEKELQLTLPNLCEACEGHRFAGRGVCRQCRGTGLAEETKNIKVKIPARLYPGAILRLKGLGGRGAGGGHAGDLYLTVTLQPHPVWRVTDQVDLEADLTIYPEQAVLGDKVSVPTPDGLVQMKIQPGIHSGQKMRLKDRGLRRKNGTVGDLYIRVNIDTPRQQSPEEIELYRRIFALRNG